MIKKIFVIIFLILLSYSYLFCQNDIYLYFGIKKKYFFEYITLFKDSTFFYYLISPIPLKTSGKYEIKNDSLILNSKDFIDIKKYDNLINRDSVFFVFDGNLRLFSYNIVFKNKESIFEIKNLEKNNCLNIKSPVSFYIYEYYSGCKSNLYQVDILTNKIEITIDNKRNFNNEIWLIRKNKLKIRLPNGKWAKYKLKLSNDSVW